MQIEYFEKYPRLSFLPNQTSQQGWFLSNIHFILAGKKTNIAIISIAITT